MPPAPPRPAPSPPPPAPPARAPPTSPAAASPSHGPTSPSNVQGPPATRPDPEGARGPGGRGQEARPQCLRAEGSAVPRHGGEPRSCRAPKTLERWRENYRELFKGMGEVGEWPLTPSAPSPRVEPAEIASGTIPRKGAATASTPLQLQALFPALHPHPNTYCKAALGPAAELRGCRNNNNKKFAVQSETYQQRGGGWGGGSGGSESGAEGARARRAARRRSCSVHGWRRSWSRARSSARPSARPGAAPSGVSAPGRRRGRRGGARGG